MLSRVIRPDHVPQPTSASQAAQLAARTLALLRALPAASPAERARIEDEVVGSHLWLADSLARRFDRRGEELDDLQQVARTGLVEAVRRFDDGYGPFIAFAVPTITGVLKRHFRDHGWLVRPPRRTQELAAQLRQQWPSVVQQLASDPSEHQLAELLDHPVEEVREAVQASQWYTARSLDAVEVGTGPYVIGAEPDAALERSEATMVIRTACRQLSAEELRLLQMRFVEERTQSDIAASLGTSQMQVSRLLNRTFRRLRAIIGSLDSSAATCATPLDPGEAA